MDGNFENALASSSQSRNQLENRGSKNDKMPRRMQKAMETGIGEVRIAKAKERGG